MAVPHDRHAALYAAYVDELRRLHPRLRIIAKGDSRLCRLIDRTLKIITFGGQDRFLTDFVTTLGQRIYVPDDWDRVPPGERYCTLRHEAVHVAQFRRYTFPVMVLLYVLMPLPVAFAPGRTWLEWRGYQETLRSHWQVYGPAHAKSESMIQHVVARFTGPEYAWMWIAGRQVRRWVVNELARLDQDPPPPLAVPAPHHEGASNA